MTMKNRNFIIDMKLIIGLLLSLSTVGAFAQAPTAGVAPTEKSTTSKPGMRHVSGLVLDASSGKPLVGIKIQAYGKSQYAAMSDEDGKFTISVPVYVTSLLAQADGYSLVMSPIVTKKNTVEFKLYSDKFNTTYTAQQKSTIEKSALVDAYNADLSIDKTIQSKLGSEVRSVTRSGQQGMGSIMLMNGINSLAANAQPLVVIDGVITDMQYGRSTIHEGFYNNLLTNISVSDIQSVKVLNNGTALYGAKGGNGVLLIDTKRNTSMATKIDVDITGSFEQIPTLPSVMNASDYRYYATELLGTTGTEVTDFKFLNTDPNYYYYRWYNNNTDWKKDIYREAYTQLYGINVQGGDEIANYNLSVGFADANSTIREFDMTRFNLRLNSDIILGDKATVRFDASYSDVNRTLRDDGISSDFSASSALSVGFLSLIKSPFLSPYQYNLDGSRSSYLSDADDYLDEVIGSEASLANPIALINLGSGNNRNVFGNRTVNLSVMPTYKLSRTLTASEHFSYNLVNMDANYFTPYRGTPYIVLLNGDLVENVAKAMSSMSNVFYSDTRLDWNKSIKAHVFHATGGYRLIDNTYSSNSMQGYNTGGDKTPNMSTSLKYKTITGVEDNSLSMTYYALGDYNFAGKYFLSGGVSMEGSSRFGVDADGGVRLFGVPWGVFPSIQGSWIATSEPWFTPNKYVNFLKVNLGYDESGNDDIDPTATKSYFTSTGLLGAASGISISNIGNTKLQWETSKRFTAGLDANLFDNRLTVSLNAFTGKTEDLLSLKDLNFLGGVNKIWSNDGELSNKGYGISFSYKVLNEKDWKVELGGGVSHYKNEITKLPGGKSEELTEAYGGTILSRVGDPVGLFYGYKTDGVYSTTSDATTDGKYILSESGEKLYFGAGDVKFVSDDDDEVNEDDRTVIGDPNPDFYGNIFANAHYKQFTLSAVFNYSIGNDIYNYQRSILEGGKAFLNQSTALNRRWKSEGDVTDIPIVTYDDPMGNSRFSDRWIEDGSYLRLRSLTLSYSLPITSTYLQGVTVWGSANNLWTLTRYLGSDPESSLSNNVLMQGIDRGLLPQSTSFAFGLKINL
jgi:TonB-linked SusC/RagA family outer membrane protein